MPEFSWTSDNTPWRISGEWILILKIEIQNIRDKNQCWGGRGRLNFPAQENKGLWKNMLFAETSVRSYVKLGKFLAFVFLSVCHVNGRGNYPIHVNLTQMFVICEISCLFSGVHSANSPNSILCRGIHKSISLHYGLWRKIFYILVLFSLPKTERNLHTLFPMLKNT